MTNNNKETLQLNYIETDDWERPVYQDQNGKLWKDVELGDCKIPFLCSSTNNELDGEPNSRITQDFVIVKPYEKNRKRFDYMMLSRLQGDCDTHLNRINNITPYSRQLSKEQQIKTIEEMKKIYLSFTEEEKPEWLTYKQILDYEEKMKGDI